jgi:hypothetical protein
MSIEQTHNRTTPEHERFGVVRMVWNGMPIETSVSKGPQGPESLRQRLPRMDRHRITQIDGKSLS